MLDTAARQAEDGTPDRERVPERSVTAARWVVDLRAALAPLEQAESWEGFASAFRKVALEVLSIGKPQQAIYLDPLVDQLAAQQGAPQRERALEIARELAARPARATATGVLTVGPLESLDGRNLRSSSWQGGSAHFRRRLGRREALCSRAPDLGLPAAG